MWVYLVRRFAAMIPTLFGVTIVSFLIMQLAPGDPLKERLSGGGNLNSSGQTREAYLVTKRDLGLDKPLVLNTNYFHDYTNDVRLAAFFRSLSVPQLVEYLERLNTEKRSPEDDARVAFMTKLGVKNVEKLIADKDRDARFRTADAILAQVSTFLEDNGTLAVPAAMALLNSADADRQTKIGVIRSLTSLVAEPFKYTYSRDPREDETSRVVDTWRVWWEQNQSRYKPLAQATPDDMTLLNEVYKRLGEAKTSTDLDRLINSDPDVENLSADPEYFDVPYFISKLFDDSASLAQRASSAVMLVKMVPVSQRLQTDVPIDAGDGALANAIQAWNTYYKSKESTFSRSFGDSLAGLFADTQYAKTVVRLVTFDFGRSTERTREPVSTKLWDAFKNSAPLMLAAQIVIYGLAIPLGILCGANRNNGIDRGVQLMLFVLYSVPAFVAGMLLLMLFAYGDYWEFFPKTGIHSPGYENFSPLGKMFDYMWHMALPLVCLSLFSLAQIGMYSRASLIDALNQDYVRTARSVGVSNFTVITKHALRNSLIPVITLFASLIPAMLGGSVLVEYLFGIPGLGRLSWNAIVNKDIPTLMALVYIDAIVVMLSILLTDIMYTFADPRITFGGQERG